MSGSARDPQEAAKRTPVANELIGPIWVRDVRGLAVMGCQARSATARGGPEPLGVTPLCFSRSCKGAAGLRARHDCVPPVERMTWGVVSPGPGGAVGDADERSGHRPVRRNAGQLAGGRSA